MPLNKGLNLFDTHNMTRIMSNFGQSPLPLRGLDRFMQKRGMNFPVMPQAGPFQRPNPQGGFGNLSDTLNVQAPPQKADGIKEFFNRFSSKFKFK